MKLQYLLLAFLLSVSLTLEAKVPLQVKKSVTFIFAKDSNKRLVPQGTGFFLLLKDNLNTDTTNFGYLVTTKTAIQKQNGSFFDTVYIRINRKDGYCDTINIPLIQNGVPRYFLHPDSAVNLTMVPAFPDGNRYDFLFTPVGMIAPIDFFKKEDITEGDELFYTGMFDSHIGMFKNIPVVQFGKIAQLSEEKYVTGNGYTELYLAEIPISAGSNGSPVYYYDEAVKDGEKTIVPAKLLLAGIVSGNYGKEKQGNNLVGVVPAYKLTELLTIPAVVKEREKEFARIQSAKAK
ncbi:MAG: hypothetical protein Q8L88_04755 [Bacteroidota bacterium]|nr:hypothetical protein [Bacteroidota bacterium]